MSLPLTRRTLLGSVAVGTALASVPLSTGRTEAATRLVIVERSLSRSAAQVITARHADTKKIELEMDVVRHWRSTLGEHVGKAGSATAYVPWAQTQILAGLVREAGGSSKIAAFTPQLFEIKLQLPLQDADKHVR